MQPTATRDKRDPLELRKQWVRRFVNERVLHLMILPSVIAVILFSYFPMPGIIIAFKNFSIFKGIWGSPWARNSGFEHFVDLFNSPLFGLVLRNTIAIAVLKLSLLLIPPIILAIILTEIRGTGFKKVTQTISYLPHFVSWVIVGGIMFSLLSPMPDSPINRVLMSLGLVREPVDIINNPVWFWPLLVMSEMWKEVGWGSILYLAVIAGINPELYEAVYIAGGGRWAKIRYVTLPSITSTFVIVFILACATIMSGFGDTFDQVFVLNTAANRSASLTLDLYALRIGLEGGQYSFATAIGLFKSIINLVLLISANHLSKRVTDKSLF
ncbi:MAG: sugar ABC transporter permease [Spirochaetales bacterium]|nr:MAG: sugar ABC transporter permease [Spirochaetales bacterium]